MDVGAPAQSVALSADGRTLVVGTARDVQRLDPRTLRSVGVLPGSDGGGWGATFSRAGRLAAAGMSPGVTVWDDLRRPPRTLDSPGGRVFTLAWHPDGQRLALGDAGGYWQVTPGGPRGPLRGDVMAAAWSLDGPLAREVTVQPSRLVARLTPGQVTAGLNFTLLSAVTTDVRLRSEDPHLVVRQADVPIRLTAFNTQPVSALALAAHSGVVSVVNREDTVIARIPYRVDPPKLVNQNLSLNYSPSSDRLGLSYALSSNPQSMFDPRWSVSTNVSLRTDTGQVSGGVNLNVSW